MSDLISNDGIIDNYEDNIDVSETKLVNKTFEIQNLVTHFEYRLLGYMWKGNGDSYYWTGVPLMGDASIKKVMLLLHPFSREVLMISDKKEYTWAKQVLRTRLDLAGLLAKAMDVDVKDFKEIWRTFTNLIFNIGDIILNKNSQKVLSDYLNGLPEDKNNEVNI